MNDRLKLLFLCTGNSCRSQMAEGWTRHLKGEVVDAYSAGIETHGLNPHAVKVMAEAGVDITSATIRKYQGLCGSKIGYCGNCLRTRPRNLSCFPRRLPGDSRRVRGSPEDGQGSS